ERSRRTERGTSSRQSQEPVTMKEPTMYRTGLVPLLTVWLVALSASDASAQEKIDKQMADLEVAKATFIKEKEAAKQKVLSQFDALIQKVVNDPKLKPADRLSLADKLRTERKVFAEKEDLPEN